MEKSLINKIITKLDHDLSGKAGKWLLINYKNYWYIKRQVTPEGNSSSNRTWQHLPIKCYRNLKEDIEGLNALVKRLNHSKTKKIVIIEIESSFIPKKLVNDFYLKLENEIPTKKIAGDVFRYVQDHFIKFFLPLSPNPLDWYTDHQERWAKYLINKNYSISVLRKIISSSNRFIKYLHEKRPYEIPLLVFCPISPSVFNKLRAQEELSGNGKEKRKYINKEDFETILENLPNKIKSIFLLGYYYGLRRNESIGLYHLTNNIKKGYLLIDRQAEIIITNQIYTKPTKSRHFRKIPHWFSTPEKCHELIKNLQLFSIFNISKVFDKTCRQLFNEKKIQYKYVLHDCRHTFISNAVKKYNIHEVMLAAGHSDISVTNDYLKDIRILDDETFIPFNDFR